MKAGQLLAEIDTPEVDQQLLQARADLATARGERAAGEDDGRALPGSDQDATRSRGRTSTTPSAATRRSSARSSRRDANVKRLEQLQGFSRIYAPFDGVITARNTDIGALIDAGSGAQELFHIAATDRLRVFVDVPQVYSQAARAGLEATLDAARVPGPHVQRHAGAHRARRSTSASRTLLTEVDVDNRQGRAAAGRVRRGPAAAADRRVVVPAAGEHADLPRRRAAGRDGARTGTWSMQTVTLGRDFGTTVEVITGLTGSEQVVVNPPDSLTAGQAVARGGAAADSRGAAVKRQSAVTSCSASPLRCLRIAPAALRALPAPARGAAAGVQGERRLEAGAAGRRQTARQLVGGLRRSAAERARSSRSTSRARR